MQLYRCRVNRRYKVNSRPVLTIWQSRYIRLVEKLQFLFVDGLEELQISSKRISKRKLSLILYFCILLLGGKTENLKRLQMNCSIATHNIC
jgi:hypothetical protein